MSQHEVVINPTNQNLRKYGGEINNCFRLLQGLRKKRRIAITALGVQNLRRRGKEKINTTLYCRTETPKITERNSQRSLLCSLDAQNEGAGRLKCGAVSGVGLAVSIVLLIRVYMGNYPKGVISLRPSVSFRCGNSICF